MKILRKGDEFVKMADSDIKDLKKIDSMIYRGWNFSSKKDYKDSFKVETPIEIENENNKKKNKDVKDKKEKKKDKKDNKKNKK